MSTAQVPFDPLYQNMAMSAPERLSEESAWLEHLPFGMLLVALAQPRVLVELGTHSGASYCCFCQAVKESKLDTRCYAVDTWRGDPHSGYYRTSVLDDLRRHHDPRYGTFSELLMMKFDEALPKFADGEIDILHIDGLHTYDAVKHDFEAWRPKLSDRAIVLFHDTAERSGDFGVWKLWKEVSSIYPHFEFHHGHGLGVLGIGQQLPEMMRSLFNADQSETNRIRALFLALGRRWQLEARSSRMQDAIRLERVIQELSHATVQHSLPEGEETEWNQPYGPSAAEDVEGYQRLRKIWQERFPSEADSLITKLKGVADPPLISVLVPVYRPPLHRFRKTIESMRSQVYPHWELCICDDGSNQHELTSYLHQLTKDRRIKVVANETNRGISAATNKAFEVASREFVAFLDHDDEFDPLALAEMTWALTQHDDIDILYTDEDKIDELGQHSAPYFKPDWSPDLLMSHAYMTHGLVIRRSVVEEVGRLRSEFDGSQDYDLILRASEIARRIVHIPKVLYHWRTIEGSTALDELAKPWAHEAAQRAAQAALDRRGEEATAEVGHFRWAFRPHRKIQGEPLVSIIVPFRDGAEVLSRCIDSIHKFAGYDRWELLLIDNQSWEPETKAYLKSLSQDEKCRILHFPGEFNWSSINNWAVEQAKGDHFLFMNNDIEAISEGWLEEMIGHSQRREVAAVGGRLLYPDGRIQHAGVVMGIGPVSAHAFWFCPPGRDGYFGMDKLIRNYSAVTGACMMVQREVFTKLGGFDEQLRVAYNDIDFCLRAIHEGFLIVYSPFAELVHYESTSRGLSNDAPELKLMHSRWLEDIKQGDPYYNPNLSLRRFDFGLPYEHETPAWQEIVSSQVDR